MDLWNRALESIREKVPSSAYDLYLRRIRFLGEEDGTIRLQVPDRFTAEKVREDFFDLFLEEIARLAEKKHAIVLEVSDEPEEMEPADESEKDKPAERKVLQPDEGLLNARYTFDNFVVGASNQFAHAAAQAVAEAPATTYNPFFIYGGVGLGKTHLVQAIGQRIKERNPKARVVYLSSESFMNELITALRYDKMDQFRSNYRDGLDVLLIDDIQFIAGKERTQEEFFHTFNTLYGSQKQIVLTSDKVPKEIPNLEERLRSRFEWGLIADIQAPEIETRLAILRKKAEEDNIDLPDEVAMFLATNISSNIRELEGSLIRIGAFAGLYQRPITLDLAREVLGGLFKEQNRVLTVEQIQKIVATFYNLRIADLKSSKKHKVLALPRQIAMYLVRQHLNLSYPDIGEKFGGKDHSTVIHACKKVKAKLATDPNLRHTVETLQKMLEDGRTA